jgi:hypothetical protein
MVVTVLSHRSGEWIHCPGWIANQDSGNVVFFAVDQQSGGLSPSGSVLEGLDCPLALQFVQVATE